MKIEFRTGQATIGKTRWGQWSDAGSEQIGAAARRYLTTEDDIVQRLQAGEVLQASPLGARQVVELRIEGAAAVRETERAVERQREIDTRRAEKAAVVSPVEQQPRRRIVRRITEDDAAIYGSEFLGREGQLVAIDDDN